MTILETRRLLLLTALTMLGACAPLRPAPRPPTAAVPAPAAAPVPAPAPAPEPSTPQVGVAELSARTAEQALLAGLRAYDDGQYKLSEQKLDVALKTGLTVPKDRAAAYKTQAFIYCTSNRTKQCESAFRAARSADPAFVLSKAEAGHPVWGPVYRRTLPKR